MNLENLNSHNTLEANSSNISKELRKGPPLSGNIKVLCRFRPLNDKEKENAK